MVINRWKITPSQPVRSSCLFTELCWPQSLCSVNSVWVKVFVVFSGLYKNELFPLLSFRFLIPCLFHRWLQIACVRVSAFDLQDTSSDCCLHGEGLLPVIRRLGFLCWGHCPNVCICVCCVAVSYYTLFSALLANAFLNANLNVLPAPQNGQFYTLLFTWKRAIETNQQPGNCFSPEVMPLCESLSYLEWILAGRDETGRAELSRGGRVMFGVKSHVEEASWNSKGRPKPLSELFQCLFSFPPVDSIPVHPTPALNWLDSRHTGTRGETLPLHAILWGWLL